MTVRKKAILGAIIAWIPCAALGVAGYLLVLEPQMECVIALEAELTDARTLHHRATEAAKAENQAELARQVQVVNDRVGDFVLRPEVAPDLAFEIAELASGSEVASFTMRPQEKDGLSAVVGRDTIGERRIDIHFVSQFHQFAALLNALERHRPVLFVETFTIDRPQLQNGKPRSGMQVAVLVEKPRGS